MKSAFATGHRPADLPTSYGYDLHSINWTHKIQQIKETLLEYNITDTYCGMALGYDQAFAIAVLQLKKENYPIKLHAIIPCKNQARYWTEDSKRLYNLLLKNSDEVYIMNQAYTPTCMLERDRWMVDHSDLGIVMYDITRTQGGTAYTVKYAKSKNKPIINLKIE